MSNIVSRRQLHTNKKDKKKEVEYNSVFVEQKNRLKKHLNSLPAIYIDKSDLFDNASKIRTRKEHKKQKKINTLLKDMYIDKNISTSLEEDTNLKLLKNLSLNKSYDSNKREKENHINISNNIINNSIEKKEYQKDNDHLVDLIIEEKPKNNSKSFCSIPVINKNLKEEEKKTIYTSSYIKADDIDLMNKKIDYLEQKLEKLSQKTNKKHNIISYDDKREINYSLNNKLTLTDNNKEEDIKMNNKQQIHQRNIRNKKNNCKDKYLNISIIILSVIFVLLLFLIFILFMKYKNLTIGA